MITEDLQAQRGAGLDNLLFEVCESLQLTPTQHQKAVERYKAIARVLDNSNTSFGHIDSNLYPQGSMRLGTTVKPLDGPHDLDFVSEFNVSHTLVNPMGLLNEMHRMFKQHGAGAEPDAVCLSGQPVAGGRPTGPGGGLVFARGGDAFPKPA